jgi:hypothetical protein
MRHQYREPLRWDHQLVAAAFLALSVGVGCGDQEIRTIERLPVPAVPVSPDRGRVQVRDGNLLTDKGTRLRGATLGVDANPGFVFEQALFDEMAKASGLNAFHVYLENYADETGVNAGQADLLVELTSKAGMYLLIGIGGGDSGGTFSLDKVRSFASFYAGRYAERTHVLFEVQNLPERTCDVPLQPATLDMERQAYATIRAAAPDAHVALFSYSAAPTALSLENAIAALEGDVDWSKASIAFHPGDCAGVDTLSALLHVTGARSIAAFASELEIGTPLAVSSRLESERLGWFNFGWLVLSQDFAAFRSAHDAAGVSWCPDFGLWPEDAASCTTP